MKKPFLQVVATMLAAIIFFTGCKKDKDTPVTSESISGSYTILKVTIKAGSAPEEDVTDTYLDDCQKDDIITLQSIGLLVYDDAGTLCVPEDDYAVEWTLLSETLIEIDSDPYKIFSFDGSTLVVGEEYTVGGVTTQFKTYYKKQ